jgi:type II secretory pathway pseudopilin PulG
MATRARKRSSDEDGFIIIEVLVSALILAIVAGAVLTLIAATTRSAASTRNHSVAYDLAQEDQARMRTMRLASLNRYVHTAEKAVAGTNYTVESQGEYVNNKAGGISCTEANDSADYVQLTSKVSGPGIIHPVTIQSVVSPSNSSADSNRGTLSVQSSNALGEPVQGVSVKINNGAYQGFTETSGCANFAELAVSPPNYTVKFEGNGLINPKGETSTTLENVAIQAGQTFRVPTSWDRGGTLKPRFTYLEPSTGIERPAPVDTMEVFNAESGQAAVTYGTAGGIRSSTLTSPLLYPFKTKYAVYAGSCTTANPDPKSEKPANDVGIGSVAIPPGGMAEPVIRVPALELTVTTKEGKEGKTGTEVIVPAARVTVTDTKCPSSTNGVKRTYVSNAGGHLATEIKGKPETEWPTEAGLPFGTYKVCASKKFGTETRRAEGEVKVENFTATGTTLKLPLTKGTSEC